MSHPSVGVIQAEVCVELEQSVTDGNIKGEVVQTVSPIASKQGQESAGIVEYSPKSKHMMRWRPKKVPTSLHEYAMNRGYLSVTDVVSLAWCEFQSLYGVLGGRNLPLQERPTDFMTKAGVVIIPDRDIAIQREKTLEKGRAIHAELEKELYAVQRIIPTNTSADKWALRVLEVCCGLKNLLNDGICREVRVFGIIEGFLVFGQIDEIQVKHTTTSTKDEGDPETASELSGIVESRVRDGEQETKSSPTSVKRRRELDVSPSRTGLSKSFPIMNGHGPIPMADNNRAGQTLAPSTQLGLKSEVALVVSDSKTRFSATVPRTESQTSARLQCMLYRRMLEELCLGAEQYAAVEEALPQTMVESDETRSSAHLPVFVPCDLKTFLIEKKLDLHASLSDAFITASAEWCSDIGLCTSRESPQGGATFRLNSIHDLICSLANVVAEIRRTVTTANLMSEQLGLTYRHRATFKRKKTGVTLNASEASPTHSTGQQPFPQSRLWEHRSQETGDGEQGTVAEESNIDDREEGVDERCGFELRNEQEVGVASTSGTLSSPKRTSPGRSMRTTSAETRSKTRPPVLMMDNALPSDHNLSSPDLSTPYHLEQQIIAKVSFTYSTTDLDAHVAKSMPVWLGTRDPEGVKETETYKCNSCEYQADCEWRATKAQEVLERVRARKAAAEEDRLWDDQDAQIFDQLETDMGVGSKCGNGEGNKDSCQPSAGGDNDSGAALGTLAEMPGAYVLDSRDNQQVNRTEDITRGPGCEREQFESFPAEEKPSTPASEAELWKGMLNDEDLVSTLWP
ncbi:hypothetical protein CF326_g1941 [Tilletia indica]|nr:hypothetical protein CF326_g1941 [Tilletia indica]